MNPSGKFLNKLEKKFGWIAIPNIAILLITLQIFGLLITVFKPQWRGMLHLDPYLVIEKVNIGGS